MYTHLVRSQIYGKMWTSRGNEIRHVARTNKANIINVKTLYIRAFHTVVQFAARAILVRSVIICTK